MITKSLDQLEKELAESLQRISKITDLGDFYKAQKIILNRKEDEELHQALPTHEKLLF